MANIISRAPRSGDIARFDPFYDIENMFQSLTENLFRDFGMRPFSTQRENVLPIKMDVTENDTAYTVRAEIPGVRKEDVRVQIDGNRVSINAETKEEKEQKEGERVIYRECRQGSAYRSFTLPSEVDEANAQAKYENGMLELTLPKKGGKTSRRIEIK
ncbi:Hsp20/alpha crystallin family protein [Nitrosospira multiformis]|jgi:HSP20 family protein|uniref:HSP20 family protein n=1 Tax=Nitrosospira multiformis TaxID=1231 RepID=A0A1I7IZW8_9PROT|nr:Hsp20/alpha crystallin family protein [Nitrosospira multiformis]SFU78470.1 HSP20 family protein [Nitrosospira multiformis]